MRLGVRNGWSHVTRRLVLARPYIRDLAQQVVESPSQIVCIHNQFRPHPVHTRQLKRQAETAARVGEGGFPARFRSATVLRCRNPPICCCSRCNWASSCCLRAPQSGQRLSGTAFLVTRPERTSCDGTAERTLLPGPSAAFLLARARLSVRRLHLSVSPQAPSGAARCRAKRSDV